MAAPGNASPNIHIDTVVPEGNPPAHDLSEVPATNIQVKFRQAFGDAVPNAVHPYIDITRENGARQTLGAYPFGGTWLTREGGQLTFVAGNEKGEISKAEFELQVPEGMTITQYANSLVSGAKAYNAHAERYDALGEDGFNSCSIVSSLIVAKGKATGLADVKAIASVIDTSPVRTAGQAATMNDREMSELVRRDFEIGRLVSPGFGHAAVESRRFTHDRQPAADAPPGGMQLGNYVSALPSVAVELIDHAPNLNSEVAKALGHRREIASDRYVPGGTMQVHYAGKDREFGTGYRQSGTITSVDDGIVTQRFGRQTAEYRMSDLTADARDPAAMEKLIVPGRYVEVSIGREHVHVTALEREHDIDRAQQHGAEHPGR